MEEIKIKNLDETVYKEVLDNGLTILLYKKPGFQNKYAFFETKYGSVNNSFIPNGNKEIHQYPLGIAHFLEHKLFESKDDDSVFKKLQNYGAYVNAATSYENTYYYFETTDNFDDCLNILLDFVQSPFFTDENVEKEKGIIGQEIDMIDDDPNRFLYRMSINNVLKNIPYKYDICGTKESIDKITKEDLYDCYNTFYNPSNMFVMVAGDIDIDNTIKVIKENQSMKDFKKQGKIVQEEFTEPNGVDVKKETYTHNVKNKIVGLCYKLNYPKMDDEDLYKLKVYLNIYFDILFGSTSGFYDELIKNKVIKSKFDYDSLHFKNANNTFVELFYADANSVTKFKSAIESKLSNKDDISYMFNLWKKNLIANYVRRFEYPDSASYFIRKNYAKYGKVIDNEYDLLESLNYDDFIKVIESIHDYDMVEVILKPKQ